MKNKKKTKQKQTGSIYSWREEKLKKKMEKKRHGSNYLVLMDTRTRLLFE
jgi:hypothetical protein